MAHLSLARLFAVLAAVGACMSAVIPAAQAAGARSEFTGSQWKQLSSLTMPLVLPANVPRGFRVVKVHVMRAYPCPTCEDYSVDYQSGSGVLEFSGSTWTAGGDADESAFEAHFNSPIWGQGVVSTDRGVAFDEHHANATCLDAYQMTARGTSFFLVYKSKYYYAIRACDTSFSASDVARIVESAVIASR